MMAGERGTSQILHMKFATATGRTTTDDTIRGYFPSGLETFLTESLHYKLEVQDLKEVGI